jgi:hypothetical protein
MIDYKSLSALLCAENFSHALGTTVQRYLSNGLLIPELVAHVH